MGEQLQTRREPKRLATTEPDTKQATRPARSSSMQGFFEVHEHVDRAQYFLIAYMLFLHKHKRKMNESWCPWILRFLCVTLWH